MAVQIAAYTDIGKRQINQDAFCVKTAETAAGEAVLAVLCDGMGGADDGDRASEETIQSFEQWFETEFPVLAAGNADIPQLLDSLSMVLERQNQRLIQYGQTHGRNLGTTASALLLYREECAVVHVGDSRIYQIDAAGASQVTEDHSLVAQEVREGKLTPEMAQVDQRRNVLTQCIGIKGAIRPQIMHFPQNAGTVFLLCSDGFVHENTLEDIGKQLAPGKLRSEKKMKQGLVEMTEHAKQAGESDNITTVLVRIGK